jgi:hypothetical protein
VKKGIDMKKTEVAKLLVAMICGILMWTACSTAWTGEAEQIIAAMIPATANLLTLVATLQGRNVSATDLQTMQSASTQAEADMQLLAALIAQYQKADAAAQPGIVNQIQVALGAVQSTLGGLLTALHIQDAATQAKVGAVVSLLISEAESMAAIVPLVSGSASPGVMKLEARQATKRAPLTASEFVRSYNATMTAKSGNAALDHATARLKIHEHAKLERWASAEMLH